MRSWLRRAKRRSSDGCVYYATLPPDATDSHDATAPDRRSLNMKLLVHTCCAPCAMSVFHETRKKNIRAIGFFYNPNIHPSNEFKKRETYTKYLFKKEKSLFIRHRSPAEEFFLITSIFPEAPARCEACWMLRLRKTAEFAKKKRFNAFTTTLLASPYQNHEKIKAIGEYLAKEQEIDFYYRDFRVFFKEAHAQARRDGVYCQNYCGCVFSMIEREEEKNKKAAGHRSQVTG